MVGIDTPPSRKLLNGAVDPDEARERVAPTTHNTCAGDRYFGVDAQLGVIEDPYE